MAQSNYFIVFSNSMKTYPQLLLIAALIAGSVYAADADKSASNVTVTFNESEKFTDARSSFGGSTDEGYLAELSKHLQRTAAKHLAAGQKLEITINDIDLAGDFLPGRPNTQDVRVIKEIYIPRVKLSFKLIDADGKVIKEGDRKLSDLNFMMNANIIGRNESLFHDKALLSDWINKEFRS
jgi:hypothetical protein